MHLVLLEAQAPSRLFFHPCGVSIPRLPHGSKWLRELQLLHPHSRHQEGEGMCSLLLFKSSSLNLRIPIYSYFYLFPTDRTRIADSNMATPNF